MTKTIPLILVALFSVACGGEAFNAAELDATGGDGPVAAAGAPGAAGGPAAVSAGAPSGGSAVAHGGTVGTGGSGSSAAGKPAGGAPQGGAPVTCELDVEKLTAALPTSFVWNSYTYTNGDACTTCRDSPCGNVDVVSWGVPQVLEDGRLQYLPNTSMEDVRVNVGDNDGMCTKQVECKIGSGTPSIILTVANERGWVVSRAEVQSSLGGRACPNAVGFAVIPAGYDLELEMEMSLQGLKIPCN